MSFSYPRTPCTLRTLRAALALALVALVTGCATAPATPLDYSAYRQARPRSILILPPTSESPDLNAGAALLAQATRPLSESGYYVYPVTLVQETFNQNGLTVAAETQALAPQKLHEIFGADAGLYINIKQYGATYKVVASETVVEAEARLVDLRTGALLWRGEARASSAEERNNSQGLVGILLSAVVNQILSNVTDASFRYAGVASARLLNAGRPNGLLYGPRSPHYHPD